MSGIWKMLLVRFLAVLLLHVALVSAGMKICQSTSDVNKYTIVACGNPGINGQPGLNGADGQKGDKGDAGLPGNPGSVGADGLPGLQGSKGNTGDNGPAGAPGPKGPTGVTGTPGLKGERGASVELETLKARVSVLAGMVNGLKASLEDQKKISDQFEKTERVGGKVYTATGVEANYTTALATCINAGGREAAPRNATENDAILSIRNYHGINAYLGINDLLTQGIFRYLTGEATNYTNWSPAEPNNLASEFCVEMYNNGKWNNKPCEKTALIVCEF